jgi:hypothetical protein
MIRRCRGFRSEVEFRWGNGCRGGEDVRVRDQDLVWQELDGDVVILDLRTSRYLRVNETGAFLWRKLESGTSSGALVDALTAEFDVDEATASRDVAALLSTLGEHGLLLGDG